jgi:peptidoglycan/LPS O-acetylase OafA/YrhL
MAAEFSRLRHRNDIQGLRAVAVILVVLNHAGVSFLKGGYVGVDVFFVLSGFLITGVLLSAAERPRTGRWGMIGEFYARRARRILPAAALTLIATDVVAYKLLNIVRAKQVMSDSISAALFTSNIHFAAQGTNYFAQGQPPSPIQQFWSLSVEEQFYLVWPAVLVVVLFGVTIRYRRSRSRRLAGDNHAGHLNAITLTRMQRLFMVIVAAGAASLAWSIYATHHLAASAYFSTFARAWELALGAGLAIASSKLGRLHVGVRVVMGWAGLGWHVSQSRPSSSPPAHRSPAMRRCCHASERRS